ncbi:MAG TPA: hypothetical protein VGK28_05305 [Candidatus Dormibacteraeota bacterium]
MSPRPRRQPPEVAVLRLIVAAALAAISLYPVTAFAAPTPSPTLDTLLAEPPESGYEVNSQAVSLDGEFGADEYVDFLGPDDPSVTRKALHDDGFVTGFGRTWVQETSQHLLLEVVIAFTGGAGAKKWLGMSEALDKADTYYKRAISVSGIDAYYGVHFEDPSSPAYADIVSFVKGNDYFLVGLVSTADDLGDAASRQTHRQFDTAPPYTIPPSKWPESARSILSDPARITTTAAYVLGGVVVLALLTGLILLVLVRSRRRPAGQLAGVTALHVSSDGRYWWDGQAWRDTSRDVPPGALRSEDGRYWWDGAEWRLIEQPSS